jgi:hypothetical protein
MLMGWFVGHGVLEECKYCLGKVDSLDALRFTRGTCGKVVTPHIWNEVVAAPHVWSIVAAPHVWSVVASVVTGWGSAEVRKRGGIRFTGPSTQVH